MQTTSIIIIQVTLTATTEFILSYSVHRSANKLLFKLVYRSTKLQCENFRLKIYLPEKSLVYAFKVGCHHRESNF